MKLSVLIPVYNEAYTVTTLLDAVLASPLPEGMDRELIVVDDRSTDDTWPRLQAYAATHAQVRLFRHDVNQGKGAAVRTAVQQASGDISVIQDADLEYDPREYSALLAPILSGDADVVFGSRFMPRYYKRVLYFWHSLGNRVLTTLSNLLTNLDLSDMETCYKMMGTELLKSIPIRSNRFGIEPELTAKLAKRGCRIYEVPISYRGRTYREGKKITWKDGIKALGVMIHFRLVDDLFNEQYGHAVLHALAGAHRFNHWMADTIAPWVGDEVLEIGAGIGNITQNLLPRGRYVVSDLDADHLTYLRNAFGHQARVSVARIDIANTDDIQPFKGQFDTVVCLNVLEHIENDRNALSNMHAVLKPGGRLCLLVPRGKWLYGSMDRALGHVCRYSRAEVEARLKEAGFAVETSFTFNRVSVPGWWLSGRVFRRKEAGKLQLKALDSVVFLLRRLDRFLPWPGISLITIARKV